VISIAIDSVVLSAAPQLAVLHVAQTGGVTPIDRIVCGIPVGVSGRVHEWVHRHESPERRVEVSRVEVCEAGGVFYLAEVSVVGRGDRVATALLTVWLVSLVGDPRGPAHVRDIKAGGALGIARKPVIANVGCVDHRDRDCAGHVIAFRCERERFVKPVPGHERCRVVRQTDLNVGGVRPADDIVPTGPVDVAEYRTLRPRQASGRPRGRGAKGPGASDANGGGGRVDQVGFFRHRSHR
jgi:hypothetical protein